MSGLSTFALQHILFAAFFARRSYLRFNSSTSPSFPSKSDSRLFMVFSYSLLEKSKFVSMEPSSFLHSENLSEYFSSSVKSSLLNALQDDKFVLETRRSDFKPSMFFP